MFMVRMFHTKAGCKLVTRMFRSLCDAEEFCDYHYNLGWVVWEMCLVDTTLSDMFCADTV